MLFRSPSLGWFNDEFCMLDYMNKSFAYICKLSCNSFMWFICCDNYLTSYFTRHDNDHRINMSYVQQLRDVRTDDIYIYHVYTLSLLLTMFQTKRRRGRLYFQERGNDMDMISLDMANTITTSSTFNQEKDEMASGTTSIREGEDDEDIHAITSTPTQYTTSDTTESTINKNIFQVISNNHYQTYYYILMNKITTHLFIICRYREDLYKPMRTKTLCRVYILPFKMSVSQHKQEDHRDMLPSIVVPLPYVSTMHVHAGGPCTSSMHQREYKHARVCGPCAPYASCPSKRPRSWADIWQPRVSVSIKAWTSS